MITREEASDIVKKYLGNQPDEATVAETLSYGEIQVRRPMPYMPSSGEPYSKLNCWYVYLDRPNPRLMLRASRIVIVSKSTGAILYDGDANDEG